MPTGRQHSGAVFLCLSVCLCALERPRQTHGQRDCPLGTRETSLLARNFKELIKGKECPGSTLRCFAAEAKVLLTEWTGLKPPAKRGRNPYVLASNLASMGERMFNKTVEAGCKQCEFHAERSAEIFLDALLDVLHSINSQC